MKRIFTSNFAKSANDPNAYSIAVRAPWFYNGKAIPELAPAAETVGKYKRDQKEGKADKDWYTKEYLKLLESRGLTPQKIVDLIPDNAVLLCYESPFDYCHRQVLAKYITDNTNCVVEEILTERQKELVAKEKAVLNVIEF